MVLTINGTDYVEKFGVGFVRELDEKYFVKSQSGVKFGTGLETKIPMLLTGDAVTLSEFLYLGTCTEDKRPTQKDIDDYIDNAEDIEGLFDEVLSELKKHNATKLISEKLEKNLSEQKQGTKTKK